MKQSQKAMRDTDELIRKVDRDALTKEGIIEELQSIHGYLSVIDAEGDKEDE